MDSTDHTLDYVFKLSYHSPVSIGPVTFVCFELGPIQSATHNDHFNALSKAFPEFNTQKVVAGNSLHLLVDQSRVSEFVLALQSSGHTVNFPSKLKIDLPTKGYWKAIFLGSGASSSTPKISCALGSTTSNCTCNSYPHSSYNDRLNPSLLICRYLGEPPPQPNFFSSAVAVSQEIPVYSILVDVTKTFRESCLKHMKPNGVSLVDAILLTHGHCDAVGGLDDVREVQPRGKEPHSLPLYTNKKTAEVILTSFPYLFKTSEFGLWTGSLKLNQIKSFSTFDLSDLQIHSFPVWHGEVKCLAFIFSQKGSKSQFVYISDFRYKSSSPPVSEGPLPIMEDDYDNLTLFVDKERTLPLLQQKPIHVMVLDCLGQQKIFPSHSNLFETLRLIDSFKKVNICPKKVYLTGMGCSIDYLKLQKYLLLKNGNDSVEPGYDGLSFYLEEQEEVKPLF